MSRLASIAAVILVSGLAALAAGCGGSDDESSGSSDAKKSSSEGAAAKESGPIVFGLATAKSGFQSVFDVPAVAATEIAADEFNAEGGINGRQVKFIACDVKSDPAEGANCALELISKGADFLIVSCDYDVGGPAARIAEEKGMVSFSLCAGSPKWQSIGPHSYSMTFGSPTEGAVVAQFADSDALSCKTAYLLTDTSIDYTKAIGDYIKNYYKGEIVGETTFKNDEPSFQTQVSQLQQASPKPDCIFLSSYPPGGATFLRQMRATGIDQPVISPDGMDGDYWIKAVPKLSDFYYSGYVSIFGDDPEPKVNDLVEKLSTKLKEPLSGSTAVSGYSVMEAMKIAIERAKSTDSEKVNEQLLSFDKEPLLIGPTTFTESDRQSLGRPMRIIKVTDGKFAFESMFTPEGVKP